MLSSTAHDKVPRLADIVFDELVREILDGARAVGDALPPERALAARFGVSRLIVRQAIHRLADIGLVRPRQGGATVILGRDEADALALLPHTYRAGDLDDQRFIDSIEHQYTNGLSLLEIAERRASDAALNAIRELVEASEPKRDDEHAAIELNRRFWLSVAEAGGNGIAIAQLRWWYRSFADVDALTWVAVGVPPDERYALFVELATRLCTRTDAAAAYKRAGAPIVDRLILERRREQVRRGGVRA